LAFAQANDDPSAPDLIALSAYAGGVAEAISAMDSGLNDQNYRSTRRVWFLRH
jgi:hypothetical protein